MQRVPAERWRLGGQPLPHPPSSLLWGAYGATLVCDHLDWLAAEGWVGVDPCDAVPPPPCYNPWTVGPERDRSAFRSDRLAAGARWKEWWEVAATGLGFHGVPLFRPAAVR